MTINFKKSIEMYRDNIRTNKRFQENDWTQYL